MKKTIDEILDDQLRMLGRSMNLDAYRIERMVDGRRAAEQRDFERRAAAIERIAEDRAVEVRRLIAKRKLERHLARITELREEDQQITLNRAAKIERRKPHNQNWRFDEDTSPADAWKYMMGDA